ncbi:6-phosphogluconolactonase [Malikia spinosa]|uniref:6-phosphogluconolactonase n=1 Tax=Malikia spinosa TaxID=86180 RepID=A0A2S9KHH2_9BURK|nr:6-phosphogluconolactonase [Malikia spinosa]PRD69892.1 6-phosphogluconolactonase [Malikia spinosa]
MMQPVTPLVPSQAGVTAGTAADASPWLLRPCQDTAQQARELALELADRLRAAIDARGQALLAVSGGKSPLALFAELRRQELAWDRVTVLLADERCVPDGHPDSNGTLVREQLLQECAAAARWQPFFTTLPSQPSSDWSEAELDCLADSANQQLAALPWPLDLLVLGMGEDAHTASLFPAAPGLARALESEQRVAWVRPATAPHARLTLTLPTLLAARAIYLPLSGERKRAVFDQACRAASAEAPISLVLHRALQPVQVWLAP